MKSVNASQSAAPHRAEAPGPAAAGAVPPASDEVEVDVALDAIPDRVVYSEGEDERVSAVPSSQSTPSRSAAFQQASRQPETAHRMAQLASPATIAEEERGALRRAAEHLERLSRKRSRQTAAEWMCRSLQALPVCIIDLETTGGTHDTDEILEVGAVLLRGHEFVREFTSLVDPMRPISPAAQRVHRIAAEQVAGAPRIEGLLPWIRELAEHRVLLFHNAGFDLGFLQRAFAEAGQEPLHQPVLDTVVVARRLLGGRCGLGALGQRLGIDLPHAHRALSDARLTAHVWLRLLTVLEEAGATLLGEVPGVAGRASRTPRRAAPRHRELLHTLQAAIAAQRPLELAYRAAAGLEPHRMRVRPQRLVQHRICCVIDLDSGASSELWLERIDSCRSLDGSDAATCADSVHGV